ncbi:MAG: hypothetical protein QT03_C0001G1222 [archaeon GW2011_AR10]|nr:MAG: hypothetical protein QT03_C0001G1222 [archaeon GW2011_AR10]
MAVFKSGNSTVLKQWFSGIATVKNHLLLLEASKHATDFSRWFLTSAKPTVEQAGTETYFFFCGSKY